MAGSDDRLQQYFDGELTGDAAEAVRRELEESSEVRAKLEGLEQLRLLLARTAEEQSRDLDSEALFSRIAAQLDRPNEDDDPMLPGARSTAPDRPKLGVLAGGAATDASKPLPKKTNLVWLGAATLALAAAVLLAVLRPSSLGSSGGSPSEAALVAGSPQGSEVVDVDFGYSTGAIFSVEGQQGERIAVVWISDSTPSGDESVERLQ